MKKKLVIFVHLLNDFSGSPKVLRNVIEALGPDNWDRRLYVGHSSTGLLTNCGILTTHYYYRRSKFRLLTLFTFLFSQAILFFRLLFDRSVSPDAIMYINTLFPFGAALYGKLTGRRVVFHLHEVSVTPALLKLFLMGVSRFTSSLNIYVSDTHCKALPVHGVKSLRIYNSLDEKFAKKATASTYQHKHDGCFNILMVASLRDYKGIPEFLALAEATKQANFIKYFLLLNETPSDISKYMANKLVPDNLKNFSRSSDVANFYQNASLVMNLSRIDQWVETFGLTVLEAMAFGIPVIVPPVGGPAELVEDGLHGFCVDSYNLEKLKERVLQLANDEELCQKMSGACRERAADFSLEAFNKNIRKALSEL